MPERFRLNPARRVVMWIKSLPFLILINDVFIPTPGRPENYSDIPSSSMPVESSQCRAWRRDSLRRARRVRFLVSPCW